MFVKRGTVDEVARATSKREKSLSRLGTELQTPECFLFSSVSRCVYQDRINLVPSQNTNPS